MLFSPRIILSVCTLVVLWRPGHAFASGSFPERFDKHVRSIGLPRDSLGLVAVDVTGGGPPLLQLNPNKSFIPASITKLITAAVVLKKLGPTFKFQTSLLTAAPIENGVLRGDLILKGGGDPGFVSETMWYLVNELMRARVTRVDGNIIVDDTEFDAIRTDSSRDPERVDRAYDAPVGAMSFNWNSVNIFVRPTTTGQLADVYIDPTPDLFALDNKAKTTAQKGSELQVSRTGSRITVRGWIGQNSDEVAVFKNIDEPALWAGQNLLAFLKQRGITVRGEVRSARAPEGARVLAKADSKPVSQSVADMLKFSNNYVAEMLTKNLSAQAGVRPGSIAGGMKVMRESLDSDYKLGEHKMALFNPSGLSRENKIHPIDLLQLLVKCQKDFPTFPELLTGLPLAGRDGTLKKRMLGTKAEGWVRAKTGHLSGVATLAGYAGRLDGSLRAFVFVYNGKANQEDKARRLFDQLAIELIQ